MDWGHAQAVIQLAVGLNAALGTFEQLSVPVVARRKEVFAELRRQLRLRKDALPGKEGPERDEADAGLEPCERRIAELLKVQAALRPEEDRAVSITRLVSFAGAVFGLVLLVLSAALYPGPMGCLGLIAMALCYGPWAFAATVNFVVGRRANDFTAKCKAAMDALADSAPLSRQA